MIPADKDNLKSLVELMKAERAIPDHRPNTPEFYRQQGELNAFDMFLRLIETGSFT